MDRFRVRRPPVVKVCSSTAMLRRTPNDVRKDIGYLIHHLEHVTTQDCGIFNTHQMSELPLEATDESDYTTEDAYESLAQEVGMPSDTPSGMGCDGDVTGASTGCFTFLLLKGSRLQLDRSCVRLLSDEMIEQLTTLHWSRIMLATVHYRLQSGFRFQHVIYMLIPPENHLVSSDDYSSDFRTRIAKGAEWILPRKRERGSSLDFVRHTTRIAIGISRSFLDGYAARELVIMEQRETESLTLRLIESRSIADQISQNESKKKGYREKLIQYQQMKIAMQEKQSVLLTNAEREQVALTTREHIEKAVEDANRIFKKIDASNADLKAKLEECTRGKRLRETEETSWVFRLMASSEVVNAMYTPSVRTALHSLETHPTAAAVAESLLRLGKQSNVQLFKTSVIPYIPMQPV